MCRLKSKDVGRLTNSTALENLTLTGFGHSGIRKQQRGQVSDFNLGE